MQHLTSENFASSIAQWLVFVDFYATRCGPCKMIAPKLEELATQYQGKISFYKVDVDDQGDIAYQQEIQAMPTLKLYQDGKVVETIVWADLPKIMMTLQSFAA